MADLRQGNNGKWTIKNLYHNKPGVEIPATFAYNGQPVSFVIESSPKTIETPWETSLGTSINLADIDRRYSEVVDEAACKKYVVRLNTDEHFTIKPYQEDPYIFQLSPQSIELESTATTQTFTVTATNVSDIGWDSQNSVNVTAGAANSTSATANFTQNTSTTESKDIVFAISGKTSGGRTIRENAAITLKKKGTDQNWNFTISNLEFQSTGGTATAVIECGSATTWTINISNMTGNWLHIPVMSGTGPYTQTITVDNYTGTTSDRTAQVTASDGNRPITYTIIQRKKAGRWNFTISNLEFQSTGGTANVNIECESATTWTIQITDIEGNWLHIPTTSGTGNLSQTMTIDNYTGTTSDRTAKVTAYGSEGQATGYNIIQRKKAAPTGISVSFHPEALDHESGTTALVVECEGEWKLAQSMTWLTIPTTSGTGNFSQQINVPEYTGTTRDRSLTVTASTMDDAYTATAKFTQKKVSYIEFDVTGVTVASGGTAFTINVSSNTEWSGYTDCEFVSVSPTSGSGNGVLTVTVLENPYSDDRNCRVYGRIIPGIDNPAICYIEQEAGGGTTNPWLDPHPQQLAFDGEGNYYSSGIWDDHAGVNVNGGNIPGWEITSYPEWITIENETHGTDGDSLGYFDVYCDINPDPDDSRDGVIIVASTGDDGLACAITVTQMARVIYLYAYTGGRYDYDNTEQEVPYNPGSDVYGFNIDASHPWKVLTISYAYGDPGDWVHIDDSYSSGDSGYTPLGVRYTVDSTSTGRYADIYLCLDGYEMAAQQWPQSQAVFRVIQTNDEDMDVTNLSWDTRNQRYYEYFNSSDAQTFEVVVTANCGWYIYSIEDEYGHSYSTNVISCREGNGPFNGDKTLTFDLAENDSTLQGRNVYITLTTANGGVTRLIYITQTTKENPYVTIVSGTPALVEESGVDGLAIFENSEVTFVITIDSNIDYTLASVPAWLTASLNNDKTQLTLTPTGITTTLRSTTINFDYQGNTYASLGVQQNAEDDPEDRPEIFLYATPNSGYEKKLELTRAATEQDVTFYVSSSGPWWMYDCDEHITVTDEYGNPVATSSSSPESATGLVNKRKMIAHIDANTADGEQAGKRLLTAKFQTHKTIIMWNDTATLEITQYGNSCYEGDFEIGYFIIDGSDPSATEFIVDGSGGDVYPYVYITGKRYCTAYPDPTDIVMDNYIQYNGNQAYTDQNILSLTSSTISALDIKDGLNHAWDIVQTPTKETPFEVYLHPNTGYSQSGTEKVYDLTLTYHTAIPAISETVTIRQQYKKVEPPELGMDLYVSSMYGGQGRSVKEDTVVVQNSGGKKQIYFSLTSGSLSSGDATYEISNTDRGPASSCFSEGIFGTEGWVYSDIDMHFMSPNTWPGQSVDCTLVLKDDVTSNFTIQIIGTKSNDGMINTLLTLHVHMS